MRVLVLSRNYPNTVLPTQGLWVEALTRHSAEWCTPRVVAPVPYCPPLPPVNGLKYFTRYRQIPSDTEWKGIHVSHPRFLLGPGYSLHSFEATFYYYGVRRAIERIHRDFPFDLIHAHFSYPDGVVAARLGQQYDVPVVITEHAFWKPWMIDYPRVRRQAIWASHQSAAHIAVSTRLRDSVVEFTDTPEKMRVIPLGADHTRFKPLAEGEPRNPNQLLFVGYINYTKGVDILLQAMCRLIEQRPSLQLVLVGGGFFRDKMRKAEELKQKAEELSLTEHTDFVGIKSHDEVAAYMRRSALLVSSSRRETFSTVLVEALASGTPVVATRCGGPEDIITDAVGHLVPPEDPEALAEGIIDILDHRDQYSPSRLRAYTEEHFSWPEIARRNVALYEETLNIQSSAPSARCMSP